MLRQYIINDKELPTEYENISVIVRKLKDWNILLRRHAIRLLKKVLLIV